MRYPSGVRALGELHDGRILDLPRTGSEVMQPFRILSWNIRASMTPRVLDAVCADPAVDLLVLSEYRVPKAGDLVAERLRTHGWPHAAHASIPVRCGLRRIWWRRPTASRSGSCRYRFLSLIWR